MCNEVLRQQKWKSNLENGTLYTREQLQEEVKKIRN